jgi:hypothetical protein
MMEIASRLSHIGQTYFDMVRRRREVGLVILDKPILIW